MGSGDDVKGREGCEIPIEVKGREEPSVQGKIMDATYLQKQPALLSAESTHPAAHVQALSKASGQPLQHSN
jgi:hypothetical protein